MSQPDPIEQIEERISALQKAHVALQEQLKHLQQHVERSTDDSALRVIDILDMIGLAKLNMNLNNEANANSQLIIKKVERRLTDLLKHWQIQEVLFPDNRIETGKARVLETRKVSEAIPAGTIIEVCRKGYQRNNKVIRPADVITAEALKTSS